jgi:hypothetical protein
MSKKYKMANISPNLQNKEFLPVPKSPTQIEFINLKARGRTSHTWALLSHRRSGRRDACFVRIALIEILPGKEFHLHSKLSVL